MIEADGQAAPAAEPDGAATQPGLILRAARETRGLSADDVAHALRLDLGVVTAIEAGELDGLGAPVFVRGYLRSYARLLELPEQEIVSAWQPAVSETQALRSSAMQVDMKPGASLSTFISWVLLGALLLGAVIYLLSGDESAGPAAAGQDSDEPRPAASAEPPPAPASREDFVVAAPEPADATENPDALPAIAEPEPAELPAAPASSEPPAAPGPVSVELSFSAECWVELTAADGRLLYGLEKAGSVRRFRAQPPLRFFVGNVGAVSIRLEDRDYAVPTSVRTGRNTARFTLRRQDIEVLQ